MSEEEQLHEAPSPRALMLAARFRWALVLGALALAVLGIALGTGVFSHGEHTATYTCPMHPEVRANAPGSCPICQMDLVPMSDAPAPQATREKLVCPVHPEIRSDVPGICPLDGRTLEPMGVRGRGRVHLGADASRRIGVVLAPVETRRIESEIDALGLVTTDPSRTVIAQSRFSGFVTRLPVATPFVRVRRGQALAMITSSELFRAEAELATARATAGVVGVDGDPLLASARTRLGATGISSAEVARVAEGGAPRAETSVSAPRAGTVLEVRVSLGEMVTPGMPLFVIADLSRLFVNVDVSLEDAATLSAGVQARIRVPGREAPIEGVVELVEPIVDAAALVRRVRVVVEQADATLAPGARVEVTLARAPRDALVVPRDAVLEDGAQQHVFVAGADGMLEPRVVVTGTRSGDVIEIISGLREGERVASVAAFLIDAESQIRGVR
jgi:Cu(I)/Ag(I) efflux system membrane fusion protein